MTTELIEAVRSESKERVEQLINQGVDINATTGSYGNTALKYAEIRGTKEIVDLLIKHGAKKRM